MKPSEIIREGRAQLFERGWTQHRLQSDDGSVCAMGALRSAAYGEVKGWGSDVEAARNALVLAGASRPDQVSGVPSVPEWNDAPFRKFDEVIDAFDRAEKIALIAEES